MMTVSGVLSTGYRPRRSTADVRACEVDEKLGDGAVAADRTALLPAGRLVIAHE